MFSNIERKLVIISEALFVCGWIALIGCIVNGVVTQKLLMWILIGIAALFGSIITSILIQAFSELLENVKETNQTLKIGNAGALSAAEQEARQKQDEAIARQKAEEQRRQREKQEIAANRKKEEVAKQARITAYWEKHADEKNALLAKRAEAVQKLKEMGSFAGKERESLQKLIDAIDEELGKDREDK